MITVELTELPTRGATITVMPSLAMDLSWVLHAAASEELCQRHPALLALVEENPEVVARARQFWKDEGCFTELQVLAWRAGALGVTEARPFFELLATACTMPAEDLSLTSEFEHERQRIYERLARLRRSPKLRAAYVDMLRDLWAAIDPFWSRVGRPAAEAAVTGIRNQLAQGTPWHELASSTCEQVASILPDLIERHRNGGEIIVVPCYFFGTSLLLDLPNTVIVGLAAARADQASRARTEILAKRLKTLADPTRLAILDYLATGPQAVGEIARAFGLAQPTVSMHVKHLRDAGVLTSNRSGTRVELVVDQGAVVDLLDELRAVVA